MNTNNKVHFYNSYDLYRRESELQQANNTVTSVAPNFHQLPTPVQHHSASAAAAALPIANQKAITNAKSQRFPTNEAAYFNGSYYGKASQPQTGAAQQDFYGKYDIDLSQQQHLQQQQHHQQSQQHLQKHEFHVPKNDFHHIKAELHNAIKPEIQHAASHKQHDYHHMATAKGLQHQMYHSQQQQHPHQQLQQQQSHQQQQTGYYGNSSTAPNGPANQYGNHQYYQNEFMDPTTPDGVDPAAYYNGVDAKNQQHAGYYGDMSGYHQHHLDYQEAYVSGDGCNSFGYPQYFEGTPNGVVGTGAAGVVGQAMGQTHVQPLHHHQATAPVGGAHPNLPPHGQMGHHFTAGSAVGGGYPINSHQAQAAPSVGNGHPVGAVGSAASMAHHLHHQQSSLGALENSNSSSDFNFLSNLTNDFAPEYYQLS